MFFFFGDGTAGVSKASGPFSRQGITGIMRVPLASFAGKVPVGGGTILPFFNRYRGG